MAERDGFIMLQIMTAFCVVFVGAGILLPVSAFGAPPVPVETVAGCVKDGKMSIQVPERFKRENPLKINPCANIPFDFIGSEGKHIRATGGIDLYNGVFVCPRDVAVIGDCTPGVSKSKWLFDSTPCGEPRPEGVRVPPDFQITYASGPLHAGWGGGVNITVKANGRVEERQQMRSAQRGMRPGEKVTTYTISQEEVRRIYAQVLSCRFFDLKDQYWNQKVRDGGSQSLRVTAGGKTKAVTTYYYRVERFNSIAALFQEICRLAREESVKEKSPRLRMLTGKEAEEIVWNLPEVKAFAERMKGTDAKPFSMITGHPDAKAKAGEPAAVYEIYVGENHVSHTVRVMTFIVDAFGGNVSVYDVVIDRIIPIEQYRKQERK